LQPWKYDNLRVIAKVATTAAAVAVIFAICTSLLSVTAHAESSVRVTQSTGDVSNSVRVTQSTGDGIEVECEGNLKCQIIGDGTVVASSEDNNSTSSVTSTTILNQSDIIQSDNDVDTIDAQDLSSRIFRMVDQLLDGIFT